MSQLIYDLDGASLSGHNSGYSSDRTLVLSSAEDEDEDVIVYRLDSYTQLPVHSSSTSSASQYPDHAFDGAAVRPMQTPAEVLLQALRARQQRKPAPHSSFSASASLGFEDDPMEAASLVESSWVQGSAVGGAGPNAVELTRHTADEGDEDTADTDMLGGPRLSLSGHQFRGLQQQQQQQHYHPAARRHPQLHLTHHPRCPLRHALLLRVHFDRHHQCLLLLLPLLYHHPCLGPPHPTS
jgi:hypothetical protein